MDTKRCSRRNGVFAVTMSIALPLIGAASADAHSERNLDFAGTAWSRHTVVLSAGGSDQVPSADASLSGINLTGGLGATGWIGYGHSMTPDWSLLVEAGWMGTNADVSIGSGSASTENATIASLLVGAQYRPPGLAIGQRARPFVSVLVGPYVGSAFSAATKPLSLSAGTQRAFGARFGGGIDVLVGQRFTLGGEIRYHAVTDFDQAIAATRTFDGAEGVIRFGVQWGEVH